MIEEPPRSAWPVVVVTDLTGRITYWNNAADELLGWSADDAVGRSVIELCLPGVDRRVLGNIIERVRRGEPWQGRLALRDREGRSFDLPTVELPIVDRRGELVGVVGMSVHDRQHSAGIAVEQAQERAERAADRLDRLQRISATLSRSLSVDGVCDAVLAELVSEVGVTRRALWLLDGMDSLALVRAIGTDRAAGFARLALDDDLPASVAVRTAAPVFIESVEEGQRLFPAIGTQIDGSYAALPLLVDGKPIGIVALGFDHTYRFDVDERRFLMAIADQTAQAFDRARLLERETRAAGRLAFLAHASVVLAGSLDQEETLSRVVRLMVPFTADLATIHLYNSRGELERAALAHRDPAVEANILRYVDKRDYEPRSALLAASATGGEPLLLPDAAAVVASRVALDDEHGRILDSLHIRSALVVPLAARGTTLGMLSLLRVGDSSAFDADDKAFVEEVGRRAAIAIDNARLHNSRVSVLRTLQQSLLPPQLPSVRHLDLAAAYHPAAEGVDVGGDFYDVFALPNGDDVWAVTMGDVCGTGARAAAQTGLVRHTVRAVARAGLRGHEVINAVNAALLADSNAEEDAERFCTLVYGEAKVSDDGIDIALACAGHPPPVVVRAGGQVTQLSCRGSLVGVFDQIDAAVVEVRLAPGDAIVFITDGIVEARSASTGEGGKRGFFDDERLLAALEEAAGGDAAAQVAAAEKAVLTYSGGTLADDAAILVLRSTPR